MIILKIICNIENNTWQIPYHMPYHPEKPISSREPLGQRDDMYMLSGCELIDTENISLPSQNMKLGASERSERVTNFIFCRAG